MTPAPSAITFCDIKKNKIFFKTFNVQLINKVFARHRILESMAGSFDL